MARSELTRSRRARVARGADDDRPTGASARRPAGGEESAESTERPPIPSDVLLERYQSLVATHGDHLDLFAVDPRPALETVRRDATRRLDDLELEPTTVAGFDGIALQHDLNVFVDRLRSFHRRWGELRGIFEKELKTFRTVKATVRQRAEVLASVPAVLRTSEEVRLNARLDRSLRICESFVGELEKDGPSWVIREEELLRKKWSDLEKRSGEFLAAVAEMKAQAAAQADEKKKELASARAAAEERQHRLAAERRARVANAIDARRDEERRARVPSSAGSNPASRSEEPTVKRTDERRVDVRTASPEGKGARGSRSGGLPAIVWALGGFALATVVFLVVGRKRYREGSPE